MTSALGRGIDEALKSLDLKSAVPLDDVIPEDPAAFYDAFGHLKHPRTGQEVTQLADYQTAIWKALHKYKRVLAIKSNKIGLSTSTLMADFQLALLPTSHPLSCRGYDQLLIAQTIQHAKEHLYTLRKLVPGSESYSKYLVTKQTELILRDEVTKVTTLFIRNPENDAQPSRIIGLGLNNAGAILSWKNVKHIHVSDPTAAEGDYTDALNAAMTRLANTDGSMIIESVPSGPAGRIFELWKQYKDIEPGPGQFKVFEIPAEAAIKAGVISESFLKEEQERLGIMYPRYYGAKFMEGAGNIFAAMFVDLCTQQYDTAMKDGTKVLAVDPAFGSSKYGLVGGEMINGIIYIREAAQFERPSPSTMLDYVAGLYHRDRYSACLVDSAHPGIIKDLLAGSSETGRKPVHAQPVNFREALSEMTMQAAQAVKEQKIRIHPAYAELIRQLKTVQFNDRGHPDKARLSFDIGDCLMMLVSHFKHGAGGTSIVINPWKAGGANDRDWMWK